MNYLESLNLEQKKAVLATEGPVLIVAGAGAGKTKTLTHRILHLIEKGVGPERILAITFTNKAAKEMRERVFAMLNSSASVGVKSAYSLRQANKPVVSTFHSLGVQIIKENSELLKLPRHFAIFDSADSKKALKDALIYQNLDPKEHLDKVRHIISNEKGRGVNFTEYAEKNFDDYTYQITKNVWRKYQETLSRENALDFDDLLLVTLKLFQNYKDVLEKYQNRFLYIHIDEYQDTNKVQNSIVELLAKKHRNLCVVGDTDQNIYSWRGAEIKNMLHFEKTYPEVQTIFLEQNYRSTKNILAVANKIIEVNNFRIPKNLFTENPDGEKISIFEGRNETDEAHFIALKSKELIESGVSPEEIAVLYRANFQSRVLEDAYLSYGVSYQLLGTKFFERKEIKDLVSFVRCSLNQDSLSDFVRIINVPRRGLGKLTLGKIIGGKENELPSSAQEKISNFRNMLANFKTILTTLKTSQAIKYIIKTSGIQNMYGTGKDEDSERLENIMELVSLATKYDDLPAEEGIEKFLTDSALASDQDSLDEVKSGVKLMTVHASKGLEFEYVFICGLELDLFPHRRRNENTKGNREETQATNEEERRLFYVAITRAGKKLFLTHAQTRTIFGSLQVNSPSEFLDDISDKYTEKEYYGNTISQNKKPLFKIEF